MNTDVSVVIPTKDRPDDLRECVASIARQSHPPTELLIVDDGNINEGTLQELRGLLPESIILRCIKKSPPDLAASRNLGAKETSSPIVLFLDDDVVLDPDYIKNIYAVWQDPPADNIAAVGGIITNNRKIGVLERLFNTLFFLSSKLSWDVTDWGFQVWDPFPEKPVIGHYCHGGISSYRRDILLQIPFHSLSPGRTSLDDVDWCLRAKKQGYAVIVTPEARLFHTASHVSKDSAFRIGIKEGYNRCVIFKSECRHDTRNVLKFLVASFGWALRQCAAFHFTKAAGMAQGYMQFLRQRKSYGSKA